MIRVLVVDDDFRVADLHAQFVRTVPGFEVALDAARAVAADRELAPDLVLLDMYLPDRLGTDLLPELTADAIIITAAADSASVRNALGRGAVNYLIKPFSAAELADRLRAYARYHAHLRSKTALDQIEIDRAIRLLREGDHADSAIPKGRSAQTAALVLRTVREAREPVSAGEVATALGISRATAQRYLADLANDRRVDVTLRYGTAGRPEHRYSMRPP